MPAVAADWTSFRHDREMTAATRDKVAPPLDLIWVFRSRQSQHPVELRGPQTTEFTPQRSRYELPISAAGDALFFTSAADGRIVCLEAATAKKRWEFIAGGSVNRVPTYYEGKIYAGSDDGHVYCLDAKTGQSVWTYKAAPADRWFFSYNHLTSVWPVRTNILVDNGIAYLGAGSFPHDGTYVIALDAKTGKLLWKNDTHCETLFRWALSPNGNIYATEENLYVPNDVKPFRWAVFNSFKRSDGRHDAWAGTDPRSPGYGGTFMTLLGAVQDGKLYTGNGAKTLTEVVDPKTKKKTIKMSDAWSTEIKGYTLDSASIQGYHPSRGAPLMHNPDLCAVIATDGVVYSIRYRSNGEQGVDGKVYAHSTNDGKELWSAEIAEWPNEVIAAGGRLFVTTSSGTIYAYAPKGAKQFGVVTEPVDARPFGTGTSLAAAAEAIVKQAGIQEGYALVLDCTTGELARELAVRTKLHICAVFADEAQAVAARRAASRANLHLSRILVWVRKPGEALPFPPRFADLIVSEAAAGGGALPSGRDALARMLKPVRGQAIIGGMQTDETLKKWIATTGQDGWKAAGSDNTRFAQRTGPRLKDAGGWSHALGDAGNTMCSNDGVLKPPLGVVWVGEPFSKRRSRGISPAILMDGVLIHQTTSVFDVRGYTEGYDQYTGRKLWKLPNTVTDTVAAHGAIFLRYLENFVQLDPWTGKRIKTVEPPYGGRWGGMAADRNGKVLYMNAHGEDAKTKKKWSCILAYDIAKGAVMWMKGGPDQPKQWSRWSAINDGRLYYLDGKPTDAERAVAEADMLACLKKLPGEEYKTLAGNMKKHDFHMLMALDAKTGKILYRKAVDRTNAGGGWTRTVVSGGRRQYQPVLGGAVMANAGTVVFGSAAGADKSWAVWPGGGYKGRALSVYDGATGKLLWYRFANYRARPVVTEDFVYAEPWAFHLRTGKPKTRIHPITGETAPWAFCRYNKQCGTFNGSRHFLFGRSRGVGYHDLFTDQGLYTILHSRSSCWVDTSSGGGVMIKPPHAIGCKCEVSMPFTFALAQVSTPLTLPQVFAQPGPSLPVKHLYIDFAATGDRRDKQGNLWLKTDRPVGHKLLLGHKPTIELYEGGKEVRRSSGYTRIENTEVSFVFATALQGLKSCLVPVTKPDGPKGRYRVRLGFAALPGDKPQQRVFDVKLNGKTVLANFHAAREAGKAAS
ncbi:MAG: PQQ-binding-like beta-propeller repeat protein, partial [Planctomycetes bacterium]|nr:PQQ-binding-like beta-propeller repeat protein [Planctomycetota bacterium]